MERVVIAGAGPVGLWLARELRLAGVPALVLERETRRSPHSKALTVHPRSLEVLAMRGLAREFLDEGLKIANGHFGALETRLDFRDLDTPYPFTLLYPQARTEEVLEKHALRLGARIVRGHAVTDVAQDASSASVRVAGPEGAYEVEAEFLVGCDGARSTVRAASGASFPGSGSSVFGFLGDVVLDDPPPPGFSRHGADGGVMVVPLPGPGDGLYRFVGVDPARQDVAGSELSFDEFRATVSRVTGTDFGMRDPVWLSRFGNATRQATAYRRGRILLAGDAAHIHFPTGGIGLNVGLQDAMNLGWKLAACLQGRGPGDLLDSYHHERHPVGTALVENSLAQTAVITAFTPEGQALRSLLNELIGTHPDLSRTLAEKLSALDVTYPPSDPRAHPLTGTRAPDLRITSTDHGTLFGALHHGRPVLLDLTGGALHSAVGKARAFGVDVLTGTVDDIIGRPAWSPVRAALIRPDGHVWWAGEEAADDAIDAAALRAVTELSEPSRSPSPVATP